MKKYGELNEEKTNNDKNKNPNNFTEEAPNYIRTSTEEKIILKTVRIINYN